MKNRSLKTLVECAVMIAMATVLSMFKIIEMPLGGTITIASMLPIAVFSYRHGVKWGLVCAFLCSCIQLVLGLNNLAYGKTFLAVLAIIFFDYIIAFSCIGLAGIFKKQNSSIAQTSLRFGAGLTISVVLRFLCHLVSGAVVWYELTKEWYPDPGYIHDVVNSHGAWTYSFIYNVTYMGPELVITLILGILCIGVITKANSR
ncbi:MAG: energy-coupled thiamine transporter ThiT [Ruminococcaceae bacterium]|nr:energy-coupled thiamine transporter ThiT [Oscillospiraceae bacterium]